MHRRKLNFWRLAFIFTIFVAITLAVLWSVPQEPVSQMESSMSGMMKEAQGRNITIYDLFSGAEENPANNSDQENAAASHHEEKEEMNRLNTLLTSVVFILIPVIVGGAIVLAILWIK